MHRSHAAQMRGAADAGVRACVFVGARELEAGQLTLKDMSSGAQTAIAVSHLLGEASEAARSVHAALDAMACV